MGLLAVLVVGDAFCLVCRRQRDKIDVLTFGGARSITRKYFSGRVGRCYADALNAHIIGCIMRVKHDA